VRGTPLHFYLRILLKSVVEVEVVEEVEEEVALVAQH
jgi:hypothetical protein